MRRYFRFLALGSALALAVAVRADEPGAVAPLAPSPQPTDLAMREAARLKRHQAVARTRAERYYRYEQPFGSSARKVTGVELELAPSKPIAGSTTRVETRGTAQLEYLDPAHGATAQRTSLAFEIVTEETSDGINVVEFRRKT
jgi:hypothetical protein